MTEKKVSIRGKEFTVRHFTIGQRLELDKSKKEDEYQAYILSLHYGTGLTADEIKQLDGDVGDELFINVLEHNKPPLEHYKRLQALSTQATPQP